MTFPYSFNPVSRDVKFPHPILKLPEVPPGNELVVKFTVKSISVRMPEPEDILILIVLSRIVSVR